MDRHHNAPPLADRLEIDHASLAQQAQHAMAGLGELTPIMVDADLEAYSEAAKSLKGVLGMIEKARKGEKDQILADGRTVDGFFAKLAQPVKTACDGIIGKINDWQTKKLEAERKARREAEEAAKAAATPFDEEPAAPARPVVVKETARVVSSATGKVTASASIKWKGEVVDAKLLPREYLMPNQVAIDAAVAGGAREIPGVRIYETVRTAIR